MTPINVHSIKKTGRYLFKNRNYRVRLLQGLNHIALVTALVITDWSLPWLLLTAVAYFAMFCLGINIGAHRLFSHRSFKTAIGVRRFLGICMVLSTVGSPLAWAGMHRCHHANSDTENDPHTPVLHSVRWMGFALAYLGIWRNYHAPLWASQDLRNNKDQRFFHFWYFAIILIYCALLWATLGLHGVIFGYCLPAVICFHVASLIVTWGHTAKFKSLKTRDFSKNSLLIHFLSLGEGLHHTHHCRPASYRYKDQPWYFFDLPGAIIETFLVKKKPRDVQKLQNA